MATTFPWWAVAEADTDDPYAHGWHTHVEALKHAKELLSAGYRTVLVFDAPSLRRFWLERVRKRDCPAAS